ncbi:MAG: hypothetical protein Tsb0034_12230 [Ekhidna sp.]
MKKTWPIASLSFILILIVFDALQQKYYVDTFNLAPDQQPIPLIGVLTSHFYRWMTWALIGMPYVVFMHKSLKSGVEKSILLTRMFAGILVWVLTSILAISLLSIAVQQLDFTVERFKEFLTFFTFQKGLVYTMASVLLTVYLFYTYQSKVIDEKNIVISDLQKTQTELTDAIQKDRVPHLHIKTGYRHTPVPIDEILWIQADDYCVKIHTEQSSFTLRQSLKTLQKKLEPFGFIRIHRSALLNVEFLDQINYRASTVRLKNEAEIPLAKTRVKNLKDRIQA